MSNDYPSDWDSRRREVYKRDNYTCQNCGDKGGHKGNAELQAHHIVPKSKGGTHQTSNLQTLCSNCHDAIHHNDKKAPTHFTDPSSHIEYEDAEEAKNLLEYIERVEETSGNINDIKSNISDILGDSIDNIEEILKLVRNPLKENKSTMSSRGKQNRLFVTYIKNQTDLRKELLELKLMVSGLKNVSHPDKDLEKLFEEYEKNLDDFVKSVEGVHKSLDKYVEISTDGISISTEAEPQKAGAKMETSANRLVEISDRISEELSQRKLSMSDDFYS